MASPLLCKKLLCTPSLAGSWRYLPQHECLLVQPATLVTKGAVLQDTSRQWHLAITTRQATTLMLYDRCLHYNRTVRKSCQIVFWIWTYFELSFLWNWFFKAWNKFMLFLQAILQAGDFWLFPGSCLKTVFVQEDKNFVISEILLRIRTKGVGVTAWLTP